MAWGISPRKVAVIPLGEYNANHYLTLLYHAFENLGWHIGYFDRDGIIAYTGLSLQSYAEEVSVRIVNNNAIIKSECVGYQFFFTDYGKNEKNIELLLGEITYVEYHLQHILQETAQELMDSVPENQFISLTDPPMGAKENLVEFWSVFVPAKNYQITPILVIVNSAIFIVSKMTLLVIAIILFAKYHGDAPYNLQDIYIKLGFSARAEVLHGEVWRLLTNIFLHFSVLHLVGNMIVLIYIGSMLEGKLGRWNYLLLYILTGICASITSVIWHDNGVSAGASGAIFGMFGILLALLSTNFYEYNARRAFLISTTIFVAFEIIHFDKHVDNAAHFGGLVSGYLLGLIAYWGLKHKRHGILATTSLAITVIFTGLCIALAPRYDTKEADKLITQIPQILDELNSDFFDDDYKNLPNTQRLTFLQQNALPNIKKLKTIAQRLNQINLPDKQREIADMRSKMAFQESKLFDLFYLEVRDNDKNKYHPAIIDAQDKFNKLRTDWANLRNKDSDDK